MPRLVNLRLPHCEGINATSMASLSQCYFLEVGFKFFITNIGQIIIIIFIYVYYFSWLLCRHFNLISASC
jgi:hypothetical protein